MTSTPKNYNEKKISDLTLTTVTKIKRVLNNMANRASGDFAFRRLTTNMYATFADPSAYPEEKTETTVF